jgi:DNA-binding NarL/FixJ family response regulator
VHHTDTPAEAMPLRLLAVDDSPIVLSALVDLILEQPCVELVGAALRVEDSIVLASAQRPDAVLVDARMPDGGGERVVSEIRALLPHARLIALSASVDAEQVHRMLSAGADVYVPKGADFSVLIQGLSSDAFRPF